jgi:hypothetical protein
MKVFLESVGLDSLENHDWKHVADAKFYLLDGCALLSGHF